MSRADRRCSISRTSAHVDAQIARHRGGLRLGQPRQILLHLAQIEEQLALRLGGGDLHQAPVAQHILMNLGADPMHREGHQAHAHRRVEALDRLHEADIAFLHEIAHGQAIAQVAAGNVHDESQVREHQLPGGIQIGLACGSERRGRLVFLRQNRDLGHAVYIRVEAPHGARENQHRSV